MADEPFTIRIFVADGDPTGIRLVDRLNWTGLGVVFPRAKWHAAKLRKELARPGVYVLVGYKEGNEDLPTLYVGEGDVIKDRLESHYQKKDFWTHAYAFVTSNNGLNKAHVRWLEHSLVQRAISANRSTLDNGTEPQEPPLSEAERADAKAFLREILQVLPVVGLRAFEDAAPVATPQARLPALAANPAVGSPDVSDGVVIVVPAQEEGFRDVFVEEGKWRAIRISDRRLQEIRYIAAYRTAPISAVTHLAPVRTIEPYGEEGKFQLVFAEPAQEIVPIPYADAPTGFMQAPRYTTLRKLRAAKTLKDVFDFKVGAPTQMQPPL